MLAPSPSQHLESQISRPGNPPGDSPKPNHALARGSLSIIVVLVLMELREVDSARMGAAAGLYFTAGEIGGVLGPLTIGTLYDVTGNFSAALDALAALCLWQLLLLSRLRLALR